MQMVHASDGLIIERNYQVPVPQSGTLGGTILLDRDDEDARLKR
jgi:hypothetical protein